LTKIGYNVSVFSFKPYHSTPENAKMQEDATEWDYLNIYYSKNCRENVQIEEFLDYIHQYKIRTMIIVETCYDRVFEIAKLCQLLSIQIIGIPNVETLRFSEIPKHCIFDKLVCNNHMTYEIVNKYFPKKTHLLGFRILNQYFDSKKQWNNDHISMFCCGGLNSLTRKNIDKVIEAFKELELEKRIKNFKLYVYIQGVEVPVNISKYVSNNVIIKIGAKSYKKIAQLYKEHDIFVHMGDHEGLGLGFYESLACGTPVFTIDTPPNNEIIKENLNGWLIKCEYVKLNDNIEGIVKKAVISAKNIKNKLAIIINTYNRQELYHSTIKDYIHRYPIDTYSNSIKKLFSYN
jgi:glycosyltransferase involved in cell wall biosynthesis